MQHGDIT